MKAYSGFNGGRKKQGGWIGAAIAGIGLVGSLFGGGGTGGGPSPNQAINIADPYSAYRGAAAQQLNELMANPSSITSLPTYQIAMQGAQRQMAAQGYTGSGNALVAAADASGQAYQNAFQNLAMLSGADWTNAGNYAANAGMNSGAMNANNIGGSMGALMAYAGSPTTGLGGFLSSAGNLLNGSFFDV